jgi:hypothetical protein
MRCKAQYLIWLTIGSVVSVIASCAASDAQALDASVDKQLAYEQTTSGAPSAYGALIDGDGSFVGPYDFTTLTYPPGTIIPVFTFPGGFDFSGSAFPNQAALDAAFPAGDYTYTISSTVGPPPAPESVTMSYLADAFTADIPQLTAASFDALQGLSVNGGPLTLEFNSFTPNPSSTPGESETIFTVSGSGFHNGCGGSPDLTSCTIFPNELLPGHTYGWQLDFSSPIVFDKDLVSRGVLNFDVITDGSFTTAAAPEMSTWAMMVVGFAGMGLAGYRASRKRAATIL